MKEFIYKGTTCKFVYGLLSCILYEYTGTVTSQKYVQGDREFNKPEDNWMTKVWGQREREE